jgi:hypothetical protein
MPHTFPPRRLQAGEPVDPDVFNETFQNVVSKLSGRLNEQDIDAATLKSNVAVQNGAYYACHYYTRKTDPEWAFWVNAGPNALYDDWCPVYEGANWSAIRNTSGLDPVELTFTSGDDTVVIFAQVQHVSMGDLATDAPDFSDPVRLQYALRVDGQLLDDTVTGAFFFPDPPPQQWYRAVAASSAASFDYRHIQYIQNTVGINNATHGNRIIRSLPVQAGQHTVELLARRVPRNNYAEDNDGLGVPTRILNRALFVLRIKGRSASAGAAPNVTVAAVEDGETLTLNNVFNNSIESLRTTVNALEVQHVEREALRNEHLPSVVYGQDVQILTNSTSVPVTTVYPGWGVDGAGWTTVNNGLGTNLEITGPVGGWRLDQNPGTLIVLANVQIWKVSWATTGSTTAEDARGIAVVCLAFTNHLGVRTVLGQTEVTVNGHNPNPVVTGMEPIGDDLPLMWVVDSTTLSADNRRITKIEVLVSTFDACTNGADSVEVRTQRGMVCAFALKGVFPT